MINNVQGKGIVPIILSVSLLLIIKDVINKGEEITWIIFLFILFACLFMAVGLVYIFDPLLSKWEKERDII